jgi:hypothetical protein
MLLNVLIFLVNNICLNEIIEYDANTLYDLQYYLSKKNTKSIFIEEIK